MKARLALAVLVSLATCLACEGALRLVTDPLFPSNRTLFRPWMAVDPVLSWRNVPGVEVGTVERSDGKMLETRINALGFRGPEITRRKPDAAVRIVCLGDSATFGVIQPDRPGGEHVPIVSYPEELRRLLEADPYRHVEVINAGVVGYSSSHGLRQLLLQVVELEPDVVTFRFGVNDQYDSWAPALRAFEPDSGIRRALLYRFHDWKLFRIGLFAYQGIPWAHPEKDSVLWVTPERFRGNVRRVIEVSREEGFRLLFMDFPVGGKKRISPWAKSEGRTEDLVRGFHKRVRRGTRERQKAVAEIALAKEVPVLQTARAFYESDVPLFNDIDYVHPNIWGASLTAELLFARLDELGWLDSPSP